MNAMKHIFACGGKFKIIQKIDREWMTYVSMGCYYFYELHVGCILDFISSIHAKCIAMFKFSQYCQMLISDVYFLNKVNDFIVSLKENVRWLMCSIFDLCEVVDVFYIWFMW